MVQSSEEIARGAREISDGKTMQRMVFNPETGAFTMVTSSDPRILEGQIVDDFSRDGFAIEL